MENIKQDMQEKFNVKTLIWDGAVLKLIDQRKLPFEENYIECSSPEDVCAAIRDMVVRGAPAIGVTAAYGVALAAGRCRNISDIAEFASFMQSRIEMLASCRPTAVNLFWALEKMRNIIEKETSKPESFSGNGHTEKIRSIISLMIKEAQNIEKEDVKINRDLGNNIFSIYKKGPAKYSILTHCNAGALATAGYGTALGVIRSLNGASMVKEVLVDETRPYLQGARLTAWELYREKIPFYIITDNMAAYFMSRGYVDMVVVGADRIAANGDTANKIGTLGVSILAKYYKIPFYVAAPVSTIDTGTPDGSSIPIEQRPEDEVRTVLQKTVIPDYMPVKNPSFDVTPNDNITAIITEKGVVFAPFTENIKGLF
jgi:methylthioribose-1-phosphate isomerase